jgi:hypothetical protein
VLLWPKYATSSLLLLSKQIDDSGRLARTPPVANRR